MTLSQIASKMADDVRRAGGFLKRSGTRVFIEVDGKMENLFTWWLHQAYPIQPDGVDGYALFLRELDKAEKSQNYGVVSCALDCGCGGTARSRMFKNMLFRKVGQ